MMTEVSFTQEETKVLNYLHQQCLRTAKLQIYIKTGLPY